jgi:hypothetical protein
VSTADAFRSVAVSTGSPGADGVGVLSAADALCHPSEGLRYVTVPSVFWTASEM